MTLEMLVMWMVVGLVAGWLAGIVMKGGGYGLIGDIVLGLVGSTSWGAGSSGPWGSIRERGCSR